MSFEANNVKIDWDSGAESYVFEKNPRISWTYRILKYTQILGNKMDIDYFLGAQARMTLDWDYPNRYFKGDQYAKLREIYNLFLDTTVAVCVFPEPDLLPTKFFLMRIANDFDFDFIEGTTKFGYMGTMVLEGTVELDEIPDDAVLMES